MDTPKSYATPLIIGIIILLGIGGAVYAFSQPKGDTMMKDEYAMMEKEEGAMMEKDSDSMMEGEDSMMQKGSYEMYSSEKLALAENGDVVLFFKATWCPTCRALDADIKSNTGTIPSDLTILEVNYDTETALKQKYGVTYQHTLVQVAADGTLIKKWDGSPTLSALISERI
ncbi:thioredoxin family protein [Patescibacteria group bacterium]|nr:thioredoxin family protein [Patescibacteria group bacterium]